MAFLSPKGMKFHAYWPEGVTNAVFSNEVARPSAPSAAHIRVCQKEDVRSCEDIQSAPDRASSTESMRGSG